MECENGGELGIFLPALVNCQLAGRNSFGTRCQCGPFPQTQFDFRGKNREEEETKQFIAMDFR